VLSEEATDVVHAVQEAHGGVVDSHASLVQERHQGFLVPLDLGGVVGYHGADVLDEVLHHALELVAQVGVGRVAAGGGSAAVLDVLGCRRPGVGGALALPVIGMGWGAGAHDVPQSLGLQLELGGEQDVVEEEPERARGHVFLPRIRPVVPLLGRDLCLLQPPKVFVQGEQDGSLAVYLRDLAL
jgi:hypothetical protein